MKEYTIDELITFQERELSEKEKRLAIVVESGKMKQETADMLIGKAQAILDHLKDM
jgi:hypothetical protein